MPQPSLRTYPFAAASKVRHRPSGETIPGNWENATPGSGDSTTFTPPPRARSHSPARRLCAARWTATSDEEQALSRATLGPRRSSR